MHQLFQALGQADTVERLGQVGIGLMLQGTEDNGLTGFSGHHEKHTLMADQLVEDQVFEHLLAVLLAIAEVKVLKDEVIALLRAHAQSLLTTVGGIDITHSQLAQHGASGTAEIGEIINDQKTFLAVDLHPRNPTWQVKKRMHRPQ
ncbi:hypothetical protein D3C81_388720 [compost metagenome]